MCNFSTDPFMSVFNIKEWEDLDDLLDSVIIYRLWIIGISWTNSILSKGKEIVPLAK